jgi:hypothetical protein
LFLEQIGCERRGESKFANSPLAYHVPKHRMEKIKVIVSGVGADDHRHFGQAAISGAVAQPFSR